MIAFEEVMHGQALFLVCIDYSGTFSLEYPTGSFNGHLR